MMPRGLSSSRAACGAVTPYRCARLVRIWALTRRPTPKAPASLIIELCDGLMLQWLFDPDATPSEAEAVEALALLSPFLAEAN